MPITPPPSLVELIHRQLNTLLTNNPAATSSEKYIQLQLEFDIVMEPVQPRYFLRIGINYHGQSVQHLKVNEATNALVGWHPHGDALATGKRAKMLLAGYTIFPRDPNEPMMNDSKIGGYQIAPGQYVRVEWKSRGWLGQTKNLGGDQLEKDLNLLKEDKADLLVVCLSETAHRKWRGEGPAHQVCRRTGCARFAQILLPVGDYHNTDIVQRDIVFEGQNWTISTRRVIGSPGSIMPGAEHYVTLCWRR